MQQYRPSPKENTTTSELDLVTMSKDGYLG
jgi:hypothetical protein